MLALIARFLPSLAPALGSLLNPWLLVALAALLVAAWAHGYTTGRDKLDSYIGQQAVASHKLAERQSRETIKVVTKYVQIAGKTETVTREIEKEVTRYADINPSLRLDAAWRLLHDAAALNTVPRSPGGTDDPGDPPAAATALQTITANYAAHHLCVDRLDALQAWVRAMRDTFDR